MMETKDFVDSMRKLLLNTYTEDGTQNLLDLIIVAEMKDCLDTTTDPMFNGGADSMERFLDVLAFLRVIEYHSTKSQYEEFIKSLHPNETFD